jgi:hypothetical protein
MKILRLIRWTRTHWRKITLGKVRNFILAYWNKFKYRWRIDKSDPDFPVVSRENFVNWATEQYEWRLGMVQQRKPECISGGACTECGCDTPDKFWEPDGCETCYPDWMDENTWNLFKKTIKWLPE